MCQELQWQKECMVLVTVPLNAFGTVRQIPLLRSLTPMQIEAARAAIEKHRYRASREIIDALAGL